MRPAVSLRSKACSIFRTQGVQRSQKTQTRIFAMTADEVQANPDTMTGIMFVFGTYVRVLFYSGSSRSFVSSSFALYANRNLSLLKNKLVVTISLGSHIL